MDEEERSECSRSCTPESLASTGTANIDPTEYYSDDEDELCLDESLEQTIAFDLETLTDSGSTVNQLELQQQQAWREYVRIKDEGIKTLQTLKKKLHSSIDKTEPFVVVWRKAKNLQEQAHSAAIKFERAHSEYESAKETLRIAEEGIERLEQERTKQSSPLRTDRSKSPVCQIDIAWQETLANATERVAKASQVRLESEIDHRRLTVEFQKCQDEFKTMEKRLKRTIKKSRPYYEARHRCNDRLINIKTKIQDLDNKLSQYKRVYKSTMKHLESLNYLLHETKDRRRANSVMVTSSEPNLLTPRSQTPDFPLLLQQRMALTPDVQKKTTATNISSFNYNKGSNGSLPTVEASKATANIIITSSSPEQRHEDITQLVSASLAKAMNRLQDGNKVTVTEEKGTNDPNGCKEREEDVTVVNDGVRSNDDVVVETNEVVLKLDEVVMETDEVVMDTDEVVIETNDESTVFEHSVSNGITQMNDREESNGGNSSNIVNNNNELTNVKLKIENISSTKETVQDNSPSINNNNRHLTPPSNHVATPLCDLVANVTTSSSSSSGDMTPPTCNNSVAHGDLTPPTNHSKSSPGLLARYTITY